MTGTRPAASTAAASYEPPGTGKPVVIVVDKINTSFVVGIAPTTLSIAAMAASTYKARMSNRASN